MNIMSKVTSIHSAQNTFILLSVLTTSLNYLTFNINVTHYTN
jgi:hypothetical protein